MTNDLSPCHVPCPISRNIAIATAIFLIDLASEFGHTPQAASKNPLSRESGANVFYQSVYESGSAILVPIENAARFPTYSCARQGTQVVCQMRWYARDQSRLESYNHTELIVLYQRDCKMIAKYDRTLDRILDENAGIITSAEAQVAGATRPAFADYTRRRGLERASKGVYVDPDTLPDPMALLQKRFPKAVFSHESALYLHDMTDAEPSPISVTVDSAYNASALKSQGVRIHYAKPEWYRLGIEETESPGGAMVKVYDRERTICDLVRQRDSVDPAAFRQAIKGYASWRGKNLGRLSEYAKAMNLEARVREVMEVAL